MPWVEDTQPKGVNDQRRKEDQDGQRKHHKRGRDEMVLETGFVGRDKTIQLGKILWEKTEVEW